MPENISITVRVRDKNTGQEEKYISGCIYTSEELKNFKAGRVGASYHREMMEYISLGGKHNIVVAIKYDDENGKPILEEIEVIPVWSFEAQ
ncbi:hypothetical protein SAMN05446037_100873 [Anaerovirgula multivorans]|uniref:Uncharacterized protein n=1 Tax=Anaerovirgula multivorans TaxID=312168 RepID=A0A239DPM0_9FIRM|nr:hypothetical protein [Anaerovirgula multivorans]SNS34277.1 hypothetical protein SAMN05446037_100873 [Anaerovirgula multivorans]